MSKPPSPSLWLPTTKSRIGKLLLHGTRAPETRTLTQLLSRLARDWRRLSIGPSGYLTATPGVYREPVRWGEQDPNNVICSGADTRAGHVNNILYLRYFENSRINYTRTVLRARTEDQHKHVWEELWTPKGAGAGDALGMIFKECRLQWKFPMKFPDRHTVYHRITALDPAAGSFALEGVCISEKHQRVAARIEEEIVVYDYARGRRREMPGWMREAMGRVLEEEGAEAGRVGREREEIEGILREVEEGVLGRGEM